MAFFDPTLQVREATRGTVEAEASPLLKAGIFFFLCCTMHLQAGSSFLTVMAGKGDSLRSQLLHAPETRSRDRDIPFVVLVTHEIEKAARERLRKDGAIVVEVPRLTAGWLKPLQQNWRDAMTKLRLWELVDFERVVFIDADTTLAQPLDDVFTDPATEEQTTSANGPKPETTINAPSTYVFAGNALHHTPFGIKAISPEHQARQLRHLSANFFVLKPDVNLLRYYASFLQSPGSFSAMAPEESLLNMAHDWDHNMPWRQLNMTFNVVRAQLSDIKDGAKSAHDKWWGHIPPDLRIWMRDWRERMEAFQSNR